MFTGLIEEIGSIAKIETVKDGILLKINCHQITQGLKVDDSVAVQGVCLTVTECSNHYFQATAVQETVKRSSLKQLQTKSNVNLERALTLNSRLGGHLVQGHIDGTGQVVKIAKEGLANILSIQIPEDLLPYTIDKGSIAINGVSLTIAEKRGNRIDMSVIPHTWTHTTLKDLKIQQDVNIEVDMMSKYVENFMKQFYSNTNKLDIARLKELGY